MHPIGPMAPPSPLASLRAPARSLEERLHEIIEDAEDTFSENIKPLSASELLKLHLAACPCGVSLLDVDQFSILTNELGIRVLPLVKGHDESKKLALLQDLALLSKEECVRLVDLLKIHFEELPYLKRLSQEILCCARAPHPNLISELSLKELISVYKAFRLLEGGENEPTHALLEALKHAVEALICQNPNALLQLSIQDQLSLACHLEALEPSARAALLFDTIVHQLSETSPPPDFATFHPATLLLFVLHLACKKTQLSNEEESLYALLYSYIQKPDFPKVSYGLALKLAIHFPEGRAHEALFVDRFETQHLYRTPNKNGATYHFNVTSVSELCSLAIELYPRRRLKVELAAAIEMSLIRELTEAPLTVQELQNENIHIRLFEAATCIARLKTLDKRFAAQFVQVFDVGVDFTAFRTPLLFGLLSAFLHAQKTKSQFFASLITHISVHHIWNLDEAHAESDLLHALEACAPAFYSKKLFLKRLERALLQKQSLLETCTNREFTDIVLAFKETDPQASKELFALFEKIWIEKDKTLSFSDLFAKPDGKNRLFNLLQTFHGHLLSDALLCNFARWFLPFEYIGFHYVCSLGLEKLGIALVEQGILRAIPAQSPPKYYLHAAVNYNLEDLTRLLLQNNYPLNTRDPQGDTPLHLSCANGNIVITEALLIQGANPGLTNERGLTPFLAPFEPAFELEFDGGLRDFYKHFFRRFKKIRACLENDDYRLSDFLPIFSREENFSIHRGKSQPDPALSSNPLFLMYLMHNSSIAINIEKHISQEESKLYLADLEERCPHAVEGCSFAIFEKACRGDIAGDNFGGDAPFAKELLDRFPVQTLNKRGALFQAIRASAHRVLAYLLQRGIDIHRQGEGVTSALHLTHGLFLNKECARLLLQHGADPTARDLSGKRPIDHAKAHACWQYMPATIINFMQALLVDFPGVQSPLQTHNIDQLSQALSVNPAPIMRAENGANPLEAALLLYDKRIAHKLLVTMPREEFQRNLAAVQKKYPRSSLDFLEFADCSLNPIHLTQPVKAALPEPHPSVKIPHMLEFFKELNFTDPASATYYDPARYHMNPNPGVSLSQYIDEGFVRVITERRVVALPKGSDTQAKFYRDVESALTHTIGALQAPRDKALFLGRCAKLIGYCAGALLPESIDLYDEFVAKNPPSFEKSLFEKLGDLRKRLLESLVPQTDQSTHAYQMLFYTLSKKEELNLPYATCAYDDRILRADAVDYERTKALFFYHYQTGRIVDFIESELIADGAFRGRYLDWWKESVPEDQVERREALAEELQSMETGKFSREWIVRALEKQRVVTRAR